MIEATDSTADDLLDTLVSCRHLIEISPDSILIHHRDRVVLVNDECLRLFGVTQRDELLGLSPFDLAPPEQRSFLADQYQLVITRHQRAPLAETTVLRRDGVFVRVEFLAIPVPRTDGSTAVLVALRDISERQRAIEGQLRSEKQVRNILDTAMDGIISINEQQNIVLFNGAAEVIFGWRADQVLGHSVDTLIPKHYLAHHRQYVEEFRRGDIQSRRMGVQRTVKALHSSGEEFPIEASISQTVVDGERIFTVILRDVTEAVTHRQQIEQQSQMLDQVSDSVTVVDPTGRITYWNQGAHHLFGWSAEEAIGQNAVNLLFRGEPDVFSAILLEMDAHHSWSGEVTKTTRSGRTVIVDHRRTILRDNAGAVKGHLCIDIDITIRKKQERLSFRSQRLESIGTLAGGIAHDLNNMLTPILMGAKLLILDHAPANRQGLLNTMMASAQRGAGLIQQLLSFAGGIQGERSIVRIDQLVAETRGLLEHTLSKSIQIETTVAAECGPVLGNPTELTQILMNLCINARDAMPEGGTLTIQAESILIKGNTAPLHPDASPGSYVLFEVSDTGNGMSSEVLDRIFDPFFTTKEIGKGTGLGLATVQGIVKGHGGFIIVYSEPGLGSKFSIYLPTASTTESPIRQPSATPIESGQGRLLLLVDDEVMILQMTTLILERGGYRILTANDGASGIATYSQYPDEISAVLLDLMMPGMDGLKTLDQLVRINPQVKVIACSGLRTTQRETEALARGAKAFLAKPYSDDQLQQTLLKVLKTGMD